MADCNAVLMLQGDGEEEEGTTESTGDGGVMMGGPARKRARKGRHYDAKDDVILRLEALQPQEVKVYCPQQCWSPKAVQWRACIYSESLHQTPAARRSNERMVALGGNSELSGLLCCCYAEKSALFPGAEV